jgi:hypothetical protein
MRSLLLAPTMLALGAGIAAAQSVTPGSGSLTDAGGNVWLITANGSIRENGQWTPGGGGTAALTIVNGVVYGLDSTGKGWFTLSGRYWTSSAAPPGVASAAPAAAGAPSAASAAASATAATTATTAAPVSVCAATPGGAASGRFATSGGSIIAPDGSVFIAKGINVMEGNEPSLSTLQSAFPGINFVRYAIYDYAGPSALSAWVTSLTSAGIVVEIEDHNNGSGNAGGGQGVVFTGQALATELGWYAAIAKAFASNPNVWFGTNNEPSEAPSAAALSAWQGQTYQAIRGTGNASPVMVEMNCWNSPVMTCGQGYTASVYAAMTNIIWDDHYYGWLSNYSTDQAAVSQNLALEISASRQITGADGTVPVLIGEYGNSTTGVAIDPNAAQVLAAVQSSGYGSAAWAWGSGNPGDGLTTGGNGLSSYGQEVAGYIALVAGAPASVWSTACPGAPAATAATVPATVTVASAGPPGTGTAAADPSRAAAPAPAVPTPDTSALDAQAAAQAAASDAAIAAADAQAPANAAAVQQANTTGAQGDAILARVLATVGAAR